MSQPSADDFQMLLREVRYLRDRLEIADVISAYCRGLDRLDPDILRGAYHPGAIDRHGPFLGDRDAFVPWAIEVEAKYPATHHSVTTHSCEIDGDRAYTESYCIYFVVLPDGEKVGGGAARYIDELERRDGKWAIAKRVEVMDFVTEIPRSNRLAPAWEELKPGRDRQDISYQRPLQVPAPLPEKK
jgi:hypothetical protein